MEHDKKLKINLITPPDKLDNYNLTFTLVYPTDDTKSQLQNLIENFDKDLMYICTNNLIAKQLLIGY
jgi:hypothetical protein